MTDAAAEAEPKTFRVQITNQSRNVRGFYEVGKRQPTLVGLMESAVLEVNEGEHRNIMRDADLSPLELGHGEEGKVAPAPVAAQPRPSGTYPVEDPRGGTASIFGTDAFPAQLELNGYRIQLGGLVAAAFRESGLGVGGWNELDRAERDELITATRNRLAEPANRAAITQEIPSPSILRAPLPAEPAAPAPQDAQDGQDAGKGTEGADADENGHSGADIDFDEYEDAALHAYIAGKGGKRLPSNTSRARLLERAKELYAEDGTEEEAV